MIRIGHGYDIHRFEDQSTKKYVMLGGVKIPYEKGLIAHSDGDVLIHAVCDALLGAMAMGDIGQHFPDTSEEYRGCDSQVLLRKVMEKIQPTGFCVGNLDITVIAQAPKVSPFQAQMKENLASLLGISINDVNIKATTHEKLGDIGKGLGIACHACVLMVRKYEENIVK